MPQSEGDGFEREVAKLQVIISEMSKNQRAQGGDPNSWLQTLYQNYSSRFLSDNGRIWSTGSIFIPLSLAGFAAIASMSAPRLSHVVILMFASTTLMFVWLVIAENHRAFQQSSDAWLAAIERTIGLEGTGGSKVRGNFLNRALTGKGAIQNMRWLLFAATIIGWIGVVAVSVVGWL